MPLEQKSLVNSMMGRQGIFVMLLYYGVKSKSHICGMNRFISKGLCIMDKLTYSAQMRIFILATSSSTFMGERVTVGKKATQLKPLHVDAPPHHTLFVGVTETCSLSICGDHPSSCMTPPRIQGGTLRQGSDGRK